MLHNTFEVVKSYLRGSRSHVIGIVRNPGCFYTDTCSCGTYVVQFGPVATHRGLISISKDVCAWTEGQG